MSAPPDGSHGASLINQLFACPLFGDADHGDWHTGICCCVGSCDAAGCLDCCCLPLIVLDPIYPMMASGPCFLCRGCGCFEGGGPDQPSADNNQLDWWQQNTQMSHGRMFAACILCPFTPCFPACALCDGLQLYFLSNGFEVDCCRYFNNMESALHDRTTARVDLGIAGDRCTDKLLYCCCLPLYPCPATAQLERERRLQGRWKYPDCLMRVAGCCCCTTDLERTRFAIAQAKYAMLLKQAETQRQGEEIVIEINSQRTKAFDSMTLQYLLAVLPYSSGTSGTARVMLADAEVVDGEQNQCTRTLKDLGLCDGVIVELQGASIFAVDRIEPIPMPVPPEHNDFMSVGAGACCSKYCSCFEPSLTDVALQLTPSVKPTLEPPERVNQV